ncbi:FAD-binding oxidoreductase [Pleurocapsales cyanobacterium LEGE 06147]|nr:FAD-binding oxidoreductase [Pleurocapsales cyanobacterium LEGE 06147]
MTKAIATQIQSLFNNDAELVEFANANSSWQQKIAEAVISPQSSCLIFPHTVETLSAIVKQAGQQQWQILPCGNGSKLDWGGLAKEVELVVSIQKLNRIIEHAVGDLTVTVEAGVKLADLQAALQPTGQFLPIDPAFSERATIGGIVATGDTGSWRQRYGGIRDMVLGLSFVRADGKIAKAGGRVVKNVAGYDLMKLLTGSYGTLGIITQITFRTYPLPEASGTIVLTGEAEAVAKATQTLRNSSLTPTAADLLSASVIEELAIGKECGLLVRFQTISESVRKQLAQLEAIARQLDLRISFYQDKDETDLWQRLPQIIRLPSNDMAIICKIGVVPSAAVGMLQELTKITASRSLGMIHTGSGIGILQFNSEDRNGIEEMRSRCAGAAAPLCQQHHGFLTILTAPKSIKQQLDPWGYTGNALEMMRTIKQKFDSQNILSPGRFVGGI